jgi:hypothetical protein
MQTWRSALLGCCLCLFAACGAARSDCQADPITGSPRCGNTSGGAQDAVITGGAATGLWAASGCKMNGCEPPFRCDTTNQQCERIQCGESADCPPGFACNMSDQRCR